MRSICNLFQIGLGDFVPGSHATDQEGHLNHIKLYVSFLYLLRKSRDLGYVFYYVDLLSGSWCCCHELFTAERGGYDKAEPSQEEDDRMQGTGQILYSANQLDNVTDFCQHNNIMLMITNLKIMLMYV